MLKFFRETPKKVSFKNFGKNLPPPVSEVLDSLVTTPKHKALSRTVLPTYPIGAASGGSIINTVAYNYSAERVSSWSKDKFADDIFQAVICPRCLSEKRRVTKNRVDNFPFLNCISYKDLTSYDASASLLPSSVFHATFFPYISIYFFSFFRAAVRMVSIHTSGTFEGEPL